MTASTRKPDAEQSPPPDLLEPAFHLPQCRSLQIDTKKWGDKAADYLARDIARTPTNLLAQIQRVNIYLDRRDADGAYGALLDLFIALGDKGLLIRRRMLLRAKPLLSKERLQALALRLETGVADTDPMPQSGQSVLSKGLTGIRQLVVRVNDAGESRRDPLEDAIEHLEYSQVDKAREILEQAVLEDPGRVELHNNLLAVYRASNDVENFSAMRKKLNGKKNPVPDEWEQLAKHLAT